MRRLLWIAAMWLVAIGVLLLVVLSVNAQAQSGTGPFPAETCMPPELWIDTDPANDTNCATSDDNAFCCCVAKNTWQTCPGSGGGGISAGGMQEPASSPYPMNPCSGLVTNRLMASSLMVQLCDAVKGMEVFIVWENAAQAIIVEPKDGVGADTISSPEVIGTGDGLDWLTPGTTGSVMHLVAISDGEWRVMGFKGAAAVDNNSAGGENP